MPGTKSNILSIALGDMNSDDLFDIVVTTEASYDIVLLINNNNGNFASTELPKIDVRKNSIALGDLNGLSSR